ncbi:MAG: SH3 domain-containing protein, partial [Desulfosarcinaceae bacterium]
AAVFLAAVSTPMAYAGGRGHYYRPHASYHHHSHSGDNFWVGLGFGVLTGAIVSSFYYSPPPPPPGRVVYVEPQPVVVQPPPTVYVTPPSSYVTPPPAPNQVTVTPSALNLRSGPGVEHEVIGRINQGDVLDVLENVPGWSYVQTPQGSYGWVMKEYTAPVPPVG